MKCKKHTKNINSRFPDTSNGKAMILSQCATCASKKSRFIKNQEAKGILYNLGLNAPLSKESEYFSIYPKLSSFVNNFNFAFFGSFFANLNH